MFHFAPDAVLAGDPIVQGIPFCIVFHLAVMSRYMRGFGIGPPTGNQCMVWGLMVLRLKLCKPCCMRRRVGRWLTDVTPLRPLLHGGRRCRFRLQTAPWALPWRPSLTLRFSNVSDAGAAVHIS